MSFRRHLSVVGGIALVLLGVPEVRASEILFTNFGAGYSTNGGGWYTNLDPDQEYDLFGRFRVGPVTYTLDSIRAAVTGYYPTFGDTFDMWVYEDNGDTLGALLETIHHTDHLPWWGTTVVDSVTHPLLRAGASYWVGVSTTGLDNVVWWWQNMNDATGPSAIAVPRGYWPYWNLMPPGYNFGLEVTGTPVPEPASLLLLGTGLVGLRAWRKRRG